MINDVCITSKAFAYIFQKMCPFFQSISIYIVKGGFIMNEVNQVTIIFTQIKHNSEGKVVEHKRRFSNINPLVSNDQIKSFRSIIERISGKEYDKVEIVKTESLI